jgi:serine protease
VILKWNIYYKENNMHKKHLVALGIVSAFALSTLQAAEYQANIIEVDQTKAIKGKYIVVFNVPSSMATQSNLSIQNFVNLQANSLATQYDIQIDKTYDGVINGALISADTSKIKALSQNPNIKYIEQDQMVSVSPLTVSQLSQNNATWGLDRIDQKDLPLNSSYHYDFDGSGVTAYVIDTGILTSHSEFGGRATSGYDFIDNDTDVTDCSGHGTHVAGTIGGSTYGVAKNVNLVGVRVLNCAGSGPNSGVISGINWVKNNASGPSVANMSLGGGISQATDDAVNAAVAAGISFVVAAGNHRVGTDDEQDACKISPARAADAITVGSTDRSDIRSSTSNHGTCLDVFAPGTAITSAWHTSSNAINTISGTSMAAPHVAGVAALYLDESPSMTPSQLVTLLKTRASSNKLTDIKVGSPNKLLHSLCTDDCSPTIPPAIPTAPSIVSNGCVTKYGPKDKFGGVTYITECESVSVHGSENATSTNLYYKDNFTQNWIAGYGYPRNQRVEFKANACNDLGCSGFKYATVNIGSGGATQ